MLHLPGAIGRMAFAEPRPWIAALTLARDRCISNSNCSRGVAIARCAANAGVRIAASALRALLAARADSSARDGAFRRGVLVDSAPALPAEPAGGHVLLDQWTRPELLAQRAVQELQN